MQWRLERTTGAAALLLAAGAFLTAAGPRAAADPEPAQLIGAAAAPETAAETAGTAETTGTAETGGTLPETAVAGHVQPDPVRLRVCFADLAPGTALTLSGPDGAAGSLSVPERGELTLTLRPGRWRFSAEGRADVSFTLGENAAVTNVSGAGWTDGESLTLSQAVCGSVTVVKACTEEAQFLYRLTGAETENDCRALAFTPESEPVQRCSFWNLPAGSYVLYENDAEAARFTISPSDRAQTVTLE